MLSLILLLTEESVLTGGITRVQVQLCREDLSACYARFIKLCGDYVDANIRQAELRERGEILDLDAFIPFRRQHSGVPLCLGVIEFVIGTDIPDAVLEHPIMASLHLAAVDMVWLANVSYTGSHYKDTMAEATAGPLLLQSRASNRSSGRQHPDGLDGRQGLRPSDRRRSSWPAIRGAYGGISGQ